ncbi:hypothetical protein TWF694_001363 [Orbilia ellipsospora]|uniref:Uncharacterized protein n=1 Tax=Orbilia ellipsospora TaxID=2528407 RepID=A0AAV9XT02_9PEZI
MSIPSPPAPSTKNSMESKVPDILTSLDANVGSRNFLGRYVGSIKEPDGLMMLYGAEHPALVVQIGWGESWSRIQKDRTLWFEGSNGGVKILILIHLSNEADQIKGDLELMSFDKGVALTQRKVIWPIPDHKEDPFILLGDIYNNQLPPECDPTTRLSLEMSALRVIALQDLDTMLLTNGS